MIIGVVILFYILLYYICFKENNIHKPKSLTRILESFFSYLLCHALPTLLISRLLVAENEGTLIQLKYCVCEDEAIILKLDYVH